MMIRRNARPNGAEKADILEKPRTGMGNN